MNCFHLPGLALLIFAVSACSPELDWREVRPDGAQAQALFPCKPEVNKRPGMAMGLAQCRSGGLSFSLAWAEVPEPMQVTAALQQMREGMATKLGAVSQDAPRALQIPGMTPNSQALSQWLSGEKQQARVAVFSHGLRVYQAVVVGAKRDDAAADTFFGALKVDQR